MKTPVIYSMIPGMENHPVFKGIIRDEFNGAVAQLYSLYKNRPLRSPDIQVVLEGKIPDRPAEPVMWINNQEKRKVFYTSMGHWEDWNNEVFHQIMLNVVDYLLGKQN